MKMKINHINSTFTLWMARYISIFSVPQDTDFELLFYNFIGSNRKKQYPQRSIIY